MLPPAIGLVVGPATTADVLLITGRALLKGFSLRETTGTATAAVTIHDGIADNNNFLAVIDLNASESVRDWFTGRGVLVDRGIFVEVLSGTVEGVVYVIPGEMIPENRTLPVGPAGYPQSVATVGPATVAPSQPIRGT